MNCERGLYRGLIGNLINFIDMEVDVFTLKYLEDTFETYIIHTLLNYIGKCIENFQCIF